MTAKIDIISGFLGAGKTTLIKKLLDVMPAGKTVIIENEFGDIGIDGEILRRDGYEMVEISTGCICCLMKKDFISALINILKDNRPERIIIEPTGISILSDIVKMLRNPSFDGKCEIHSLITVIDCENFMEQHEMFGEFFTDQITNATHLLLSKIQNVTPEEAEKVLIAARSMNPNAPLIAKNWDDLSIEELDDCADGDVRLDPSRVMAEPERRSCRDHRFSTFAAELPQGMTLETIRRNLDEMKSGKFGGSLRGKGFVRTDGGAKNYVFSFTNGKYEIEPADSEVSGRVCFIGLDFDEAGLEKLWGA